MKVDDSIYAKINAILHDEIPNVKPILTLLEDGNHELFFVHPPSQAEIHRTKEIIARHITIQWKTTHILKKENYRPLSTRCNAELVDAILLATRTYRNLSYDETPTNEGIALIDSMLTN